MKKRKSETLILSDTDSEADDDAENVRRKIARLEAEIAALRGEAKSEQASSPMRVKREATVAQKDVKVLEEDGRVVLELLDDDV